MFYPCFPPSVGLLVPNGIDNTHFIPKIEKVLDIKKKTKTGKEVNLLRITSKLIGLTNKGNA